MAPIPKGGTVAVTGAAGEHPISSSCGSREPRALLTYRPLLSASPPAASWLVMRRRDAVLERRIRIPDPLASCLPAQRRVFCAVFELVDMLIDSGTGYIGSWVVKLLLDDGYNVKACVRDVSDPEKTDFLRGMPGFVTGRLTLHSCDLSEEGVFDDVFPGCHGVCHVGADLGGPNDERVALCSYSQAI